MTSEAIAFLGDVEVQEQIDRIAQALLDLDKLTSEQIRTLARFSVSHAPYKQQARE